MIVNIILFVHDWSASDLGYSVPYRHCIFNSMDSKGLCGLLMFGSARMGRLLAVPTDGQKITNGPRIQITLQVTKSRRNF